MIQTEAEYNAVMRRLDALMDAEPGTPEGDELERLSKEIEVYEEKHHPIPFPAPRELAEFRREQEIKPE